MKQISQNLLNEQIALNRKPAVKLQIQAYNFPAESSKIMFNQYDWTSVLETSKGAAAACCASDGSFVITSGTGATTVRIANSPAIDLDTVFTTWGAAGTKGTFAAGNTFCIGANPTSNEVIIAYLSGGHLYRQTSTNYGASFGSATDMGASSGTVVRMAYTPTGNCAIVVGYTTSTYIVYGVYDRRYYINLKAYIRRGGVWGSAISLSQMFDYYKFTIGTYTVWQQTPLYFAGIDYVEVVLESIDIAYDDDWFVTFTGSQTKAGSDGGSGHPISKGEIIYGLYSVVIGNGTNATPNSWSTPAEISLVDTKVNINSLSQLSHFSPSPPTKEELAYQQTTMPILLSQPELLRTANVHPAAYLHKVSGYPLILTLYSDGRCYLCELQRGTTILTATFDKAYTFYNDRPVKLASNSTWLFAYNGDQIFMSPLPGFWSVPTIGTGAGSYNEIAKAKILAAKETVNVNATSTLDVVLQNYDSYFDSPGVGDINRLAIGSRVNLFLGYNKSSTDYYEEFQRYFVDSWGYTRAPNLAEFTLHCIDAWGLLEKYKFNRKVSFNYSGATTTYSIYELIEMLCKAIGGSLSYINRSSYITAFKPVIEVNAGENAANLLRRLLAVVPDVIRFYGNAGYVVYPQTGDKSTYLLKFPVT